MDDIKALLQESARWHSHLCPRQVLGVRMGLAGLAALGLDPNRGESKRLLLISETDGCFVDGLIAVSGCTVGHRTLRVEDYGKPAATFVDVQDGRCLRVAPHGEVRARAAAFMPEQTDSYQAQLLAYQSMPAEDMFVIQAVRLLQPIEKIVSLPGLRVLCDGCGEEIMNAREVLRAGRVLCQVCAGVGYYCAAGESD